MTNVNLKKLGTKEAVKEIEKVGGFTESDQQGVQRVVLQGIIIDGSIYSPLNISVQAPPAKVKRYQLALQIKDTPVVLGLFEYEYEAKDAAKDLPEDKVSIKEVEVADE